MCGRFTRDYTWAQIYAMYSLIPSVPTSNLQPRYNICPTTTIDAIVPAFDKRELVPMRWGLIPNWWSKPLKEMKLATFNARAETVAEKPMFRDAFRKRRCLIPASGYYEWQDTPEGKQPYYFTRRDGELMTIAGLYDSWLNKETNETVKSCAMLITSPNEFVAEVHDRMPVILEQEHFETWLTGNGQSLSDLLRPAENDVLQKMPVSKRVNSSRTSDEDASLIEGLTADAE
jgi:putative SOS response-associated peptidase YedK